MKTLSGNVMIHHVTYIWYFDGGFYTFYKHILVQS